LLLQNNCAGGSDETAVSPANSGGASGDAWSDVNASNGSDVYDNARSPSGVFSQRFGINATPSGVNRVTWAFTAVTTIFGRCYLYRTANPTTTGQQFAGADLIGTGACAFFDINTSGQPRCWDSVSTSTTFTNPITLDAWMRFEYRIVMSTTVGVVELDMYEHHSNTLIESKALTGANTRASADQFLYGENWVQDNGATFWMGDFLINDTGKPGPSVAASALNYKRRNVLRPAPFAPGRPR